MNQSLILSACCLTGVVITGCSLNLPQKPNIVFINADDIGIGDLECYGTTSVQTPNVNRLAGSGKRFVNAYSCAATSTPSRYGLLTGLYPWRRDNTGIARGDAPMIIHKDQYTVASLLRDAGYSTAALGKWHLGLGEGDYNCQNWNGFITPGPKDIGFDYSYIMAATGDRTPCVFIENQRKAFELLGDHKPAGVYRGGKYSSFEAGTRIPFIISWPGKVTNGTSDALISQIDLFGSLAKLTGQAKPEKAASDSHNSLDTWLNKSAKDRDYVIQQSVSGTLSIVSGNWKYITPSKSERIDLNTHIELGQDTIPQLYNLKDDAGERKNIAYENPVKVKELSLILESLK